MAKQIGVSNKAALLEKLYDESADPLTREEVMELALSYVIPRGDNSALAKRLLENFGSFSDVLTTDWLILKEVEGLTERSAKALSLLFEVFEYYVETGLDKRYVFEGEESVSDFFEELLRFKQVEMTYIIGLDSKGRIKSKHKLATGGMKSVGVSTHDVARFVTSTKPAVCYMCHNHPNGSAVASETDRKGNQLIHSLCSKLKVDLVDHIIVGVDGVYSMKNNQFLRQFSVN